MKHTIIFLSIAILFGCKKDKEVADTVLPVVQLNTPTNSQVFVAGQMVNINATITDNNKIKIVHLEIINTATGAFIVHEHYSPAAASYTLSRTFTTQASTAYKIKVEAHDEKDNTAKTEITVSSN